MPIAATCPPGFEESRFPGGHDFEKHSGSVLKFIQPYLPEPARAAVARGGFKISYTDYDWTLNDAAGK